MLPMPSTPPWLVAFAMRKAEDDAECRVVIITGEGPGVLFRRGS